jgi:hypothetical protein
MAQPIVACAGSSGTLTVNGVAVHVHKWVLKVAADVIKYKVTGQTADGDGVYWVNKIRGGFADGTIEIEGYWDSNAVATAKVTGTTIKLRPGTTAAGSVVCSFVAGDAFTASVIVSMLEGSIDTDATTPSPFRASCEVDGAVTYPT